MTDLLIFGFSFAATTAGVALVRRFGAARLVDMPNERSSHDVPTVRGGGLAIVFVCLVLYIAGGWLGFLSINWNFVVSATLVAGVSYADDLFSLPAWTRLIAHLASVGILLAGSGSIGRSYLPGVDSVVDLGRGAEIVYFIWIVWMINAFNFMDGIDGIAGAQGLVAGVGWVAVGIVLGDPGLYLFGGVIALSCLGFLIHNWSPAGIFMGDVGSAFLGFTLAAMPLLGNESTRKSDWLLVAALTFLWLFFADTVYTFARRALRGEKVWKPHREHLYQRLVIAGSTHSRVATLYLVLTVVNSIVFLAVLRFNGTFGVLLIFSYLASALLVLIAAHRKKH